MIESELTLSPTAVAWGALLGVGLSLGGVYFGGLWLTLRSLPQRRRPFVRLRISMLLRLTVLLVGGAWVVQQAIAPPLLAILLMSLGFWLSRTLLITLLLIHSR